jgi:hypothetical protein
MAKDAWFQFEDISWLAVKKGDPARIVELLSLSGPVEASWNEGLSAVYDDYFNPKGDQMSRVYITPLVQGWRLVLGGWFGASSEDHLEGGQRSYRKIAAECRKLSTVFGQAGAFTLQWRMVWFSWILAREGKVVRQYVVEDEEVLVDSGRPAAAEAKARADSESEDEDGEWCGDGVDVVNVAQEFSVFPERLGAKTKGVGKGFLALTPWDRKRGVPVRRP